MSASRGHCPANRATTALSGVAGAALSFVAALVASADPAPPEGFVVEPIGGTWDGLAGVLVLGDGRSIAWERGGTLWMIDADGTRHPRPMLDIHDEVGAWRDHGLLGVAADPDFLENGRLYLLYVVDRHHLLFAGTPQYDPEANLYFAASIGRVTRYAATASSDFTQVDPASRTVLLGESASTGIPITHQSHGVGTLLFGDDGTLLVSAGDGASYEEVDLGGAMPGGYAPQALADGILSPKEDVGAFRAQLVDSLCGKILRIDPETGDGVAGNPFFDAASPRAAQSRVWCLGLRNPFRMDLIPHSGHEDPGESDPGTLVIGDVGWTEREEIDVAEQGGSNFGWPIFEGHSWLDEYALANVANADAPNPLAAAPASSCLSPNFLFRDLLVQDELPAPFAANPCGLLQAEDAQWTSMVVDGATPGFTGAAALRFLGGSIGIGTVQWTVENTGAAPADLWVRYSLVGNSSALLQLTVDGAPAGVLLPPGTARETNYRWETFPGVLPPGSHDVVAMFVGPPGPFGGLKFRLDALAVTEAGSLPERVPSSVPSFVHRRPVLDWWHGGAVARVPGHSSNGMAVESIVGSPESACTGAPFPGSCSIAGGRVGEGAWPREWHGMQIVADYAAGWIRGLRMDASHRVTEVIPFDALAGTVIGARYDPVDDSLYVIRWHDQLVRIRFDPSASGAPVVNAKATPSWGASPLVAVFDAGESFDPEGGPLTFTWNFGDGSAPVNGAMVHHIFTSTEPARHDVIVTARDQEGLETSLVVPVWTMNSPPLVDITSLEDGQLYPMDGKTFLPLQATIVDAEQSDLACAWVTILHHNTHSHSEPVDPACTTGTLITPVGCGEETYFYEVRLTVTDPLGLSATDSIALLPDCEGVLSCPADFDQGGEVDGADLGLLMGHWGMAGPDLVCDLTGDDIVDGSDLGELLAAWGACP